MMRRFGGRSEWKLGRIGKKDGCSDPRRSQHRSVAEAKMLK